MRVPNKNRRQLSSYSHFLAPRWKIYINALKNWIDNLNVLTKWVFIVSLKSLFVSLVLGALAPYATAFYAVRNGFRVPVEGVPYINFAISVFSFGSFFIAVGMFTLFMLFLNQISILDWVSIKLVSQSSRQLEFRDKFRGSRGMLIASAAFIIFFIFIFISDILHDSYITIFGKDVYLKSLLLLMLSSASICLVSFYWISKGYGAFQVQVMLSVPLVLIMAASLFVPDVYGSFLRLIRYGGGIYATITTKSDDASTANERKGYILIQNEKYIILLSEDRRGIYEIPYSIVINKYTDISPVWKYPIYSINEQFNNVVFDLKDRFY